MGIKLETLFLGIMKWATKSSSSRDNTTINKIHDDFIHGTIGRTLRVLGKLLNKLSAESI